VYRLVDGDGLRRRKVELGAEHTQPAITAVASVRLHSSCRRVRVGLASIENVRIPGSHLQGG
jgi:hypothetical protein